MSSGINLLPQKQVVKKGIRKVVLASIVMFGAVTFLSLAVLVYSFYLNTQVDNLTNKEQELSVMLQQQSAKQAKLVRLSDRMMNITSLLNSRNKLDKKIESIFNFIKSDVLINSFIFDGNSIAVSFLSPDLYDLDDIITRIESSKKIPEVSKVEISSLKYDVLKNNYVLSLLFYFQ